MSLEIHQSNLQNGNEDIFHLEKDKNDGRVLKKENIKIVYHGKEEGGTVVIKLNEGQPNQHRFDLHLEPGSSVNMKDLGLEIKAR
jgi:hypothetical protein